MTLPKATRAQLFPLVERKQLTWRHPRLDAGCVVDLVRLFAQG